MDRPLSTEDALVYVMITTSVADLHMANVELDTIRRIVETAPVFTDFAAERLPGLAETVADILAHEDGIDRILGLVERSLPQRLAETAYALAVEVASADVVAEQEELRFLELLRDGLDLDPLVTAAIERSARVRYRRA